MTTVKATLDDFHTSISNLHPLEQYDTIQGRINNSKFEIKYTPQEQEELRPIYGNYKISVFAPQQEEREGGIVLYTEAHLEPKTDVKSLLSLFSRGRKIAQKITTDDSLHQCPYCKFLATEEWRIEKNLPLFTRRTLKRSVPGLDHNNRDASQCAGLCSWIPPKIEVYTHHKDENPIFDYSELENCKTLLRTLGYPKWAYKSHIPPHKYFYLKKMLETNPTAFEETLDIQTVTEVIDSLNKGEASNKLTPIL